MSTDLAPSMLLLLLAIGSIFVLPLPCKGINIYVTASKDSDCTEISPCKTLDEYANDTQLFRGIVNLYFLTNGPHNLSMDLLIDQVETMNMAPASVPRVAVTYDIQLFGGNIILESLNYFYIHALTIRSTAAVNYGLVIKNAQEVVIWEVRYWESSVIYTHSLNAQYQSARLALTQSTFKQSSGSGLQITDRRTQGLLDINIITCQFSNNQQGGLVIESSANMAISMLKTEILENTIYSSGTGYAAALSINSISHSNTNVTIRSGSFYRNQDLRGQPEQSVVYVSRANEVSLALCWFEDNHGTGIRVDNIKTGLRTSGSIRFRNNTAPQGGAISLVSTQILLMPGANILFQDNYAYDVGGAIHVNPPTTVYEANNLNTRSQCFYMFTDWNVPRFDYNIAFVNNSAENGGNHIYGASLKSYCVVYINKTSETPYIRSNDPQVQELFHFEGGEDSPISSPPSRVCIIDPNKQLNFSENCADESQIFMTKSVYPGEEFELQIILVGAEFGSVTGDVFAQFLLINDDKPKLQSQFLCSRRINEPHTPKPFNYSVFSKYKKEIMVLTAHHGNISEFGSIEKIREYIKEYKDSGTIPTGLLTTPVFVDLILKDCPSGFYLDCKSTICQCTCSPYICNDRTKNKGEIFNGTVNLHLSDNTWVKVEDDGGITLLRNCPFDYCKRNSTVDLNDSDTQCAMNHAGTICGECKDGYSIVLGSNECHKCPDNVRIVLIVAFAAAGIILVLFIKLLNMTVSQGTINGLIFYANIIWAYQNIFFQESHVDGANYMFLKVFIAWINLDLGIVTCFIKGLTPYVKIWLQFLFPIYVWSIAGAMILLANCSTRITRLFGNNLIQVLATLFLLSYAKLLRTIITTIVPAQLLVYNSTAPNVSDPTQVLYVWAFDGNLEYGSVPHMILLVVSLLVLIFLWLPYTFALLFIQPLRKNSHVCCLRWVNRWKPLFDAYTGPLSPQNHFWIGLLLLARVILLLIFALSYAFDPSISLLALIIMVVLLLTVLSYTGQLYDAPTKITVKFLPGKISFRSILEASFLLNLIVVAGSVLYNNIEVADGTKARSYIVHTSVGIALLEFIGIVLYHVFCAVKTCYRKQTLKFNEYQNLEESQNRANVDRNTIHISNADNKSYRSSRVRETLLTDHESTT